ncbi:antibiotic biosynthesis monooxygenase [Flagellimonas sp. DF-77]|uniref:antibiotic biosynthesis monooxygenase family protein n=1 Tax=Flagellimonas algarum TaxID=3230298 RepID=UPI0033918AC7
MEIKKPYYAVIFSNLRTEGDNGYPEMADAMEKLARTQKGFLGFESARDGFGIAISYWESLDDIAKWKANTAHLKAQENGRSQWYSWYKVRICKVEREYSFEK